MIRKIAAAMARLDDHWIGDAIGVASLFAMLSMGLFGILAFGGAQ